MHTYAHRHTGYSVPFALVLLVAVSSPTSDTFVLVLFAVVFVLGLLLVLFVLLL
jgi:hypothetical protein